MHSTHKPIELNLYFTSHCHLCELAELMLSKIEIVQRITVTKYEITDSDILLEQYSTKIPVIKRADSKTELCWPFTESEIKELVSAQHK